MAEEQLKVTILVDRKQFEKMMKEAGKTADKFKDKVDGTSAGVKKFGAQAAVTAAALATLRAGFMATGEGADKLERMTQGLKAGIGELGRAVVNLDFSNLLTGLGQAVGAATDFADALDQANQRMSDFKVLKASFTSEVQTLRLKSAEGTITPEETARLKTLSSQLQSSEEGIYQQAIEDLKQYISTRTGLESQLFNRIEQGIRERAVLNKTELDGIADVGDRYKAEQDRLKKMFPDEKITMMTPGGPRRMSVVTKEYTDALALWINSLSGAELAQLTEDKLIGSPEMWQALIANMEKRNQLQGEYALASAKVQRGLNKATEAEEGYGEAAVQAAIEWDEFIKKFRGGIGGDFTPATISLDQKNPTQPADNIGASVAMFTQEQIGLAMELGDVFSNVFMSATQGWEAMTQAIIDSIKRIAAEILAKAAAWAILNILFPGSGATFSSFMGLTGAGGGASGGILKGILGSVGSAQNSGPLQVQGVISGRDIAIINARGSGQLNGGT